MALKIRRITNCLHLQTSPAFLKAATTAIDRRRRLSERVLLQTRKGPQESAEEHMTPRLWRAAYLSAVWSVSPVLVGKSVDSVDKLLLAMDLESVLCVRKDFLESLLHVFCESAMKSEFLTGGGAVRKKGGWRISKYKAAGDRFFTLKIRKVK